MQQLFGEKQTQPLREVQSKVVISVAPHFSSFRKEQSSRTRFYDKGFCQSSMDTRRCCIFRWKRSFATNIFGVPTKPFHQTPNLQQKDSRYSCHLAVAIRRFATKVVQLPCTEGGYSVSAGPSKIDKSLEQGSAEGATPLVVQRSALSESLIRQQAQVLGGASTIKKILYNEIAVDVDSSTVTARKRKTFLSIMNRQYQEKRKLSLIYGYLPHKQINRLVNKALHFQKKLSFTTSQHFFNLLEGRADIILYRSGFAANVYAAKKMVSHGLVKINDRVITTPSIVLSPGDILSVSSSALSHIIRFLSLNRKQRKIHKPLNAPARRGGFSKLRRTARGFSQSMIDNRPKILSYKDCSFFFRPKLKRKPKRISRRKKKSKKRFPS